MGATPNGPVFGGPDNRFLAIRQITNDVPRPPLSQPLRHNKRVYYRSAIRDSANGFHELIDVRYSILQQAADSSSALTEELGRLVAFDVVGEK